MLYVFKVNEKRGTIKSAPDFPNWLDWLEPPPPEGTLTLRCAFHFDRQSRIESQTNPKRATACNGRATAMQIGLDHWDGDTGFLGHVASRKEGDPVVESVGEWMATPLNFAVAGRRPRIAAPCRIFLANNEKGVPPWNAGPGNMAE